MLVGPCSEGAGGYADCGVCVTERSHILLDSQIIHVTHVSVVTSPLSQLCELYSHVTSRREYMSHVAPATYVKHTTNG